MNVFMWVLAIGAVVWYEINFLNMYYKLFAIACVLCMFACFIFMFSKSVGIKYRLLMVIFFVLYNMVLFHILGVGQF